jgi:GH43 family beta-xylosidase
MKTPILFLAFFCLWGCRENAGTDPKESLLRVETLAATDVTDHRALCGGKIINKNDRITSWGVELFHGNDPEPVIHRKTDAFSGDIFGISLSALEPQQTYRFRAFADDGALRYGRTESFTTPEEETEGPLQVETLPATGITATVALCGGKISNRNPLQPFAAWGIELFYEGDTVTYERTYAFPGDEFKITVSGLGAQQPYGFRAFADDGTRRFGEDRQFTTAAPTVIAQHIPLADPFILLHKGVYYAYGTRNDDTGTGFSAYISHDLVHWRRHPTLVLSENDCWGTNSFWAPEVYYINGKFYMYYSAEEHIGAAVADSPTGPFRQETKKPMVEDEKCIDNTLFIDDDGKAYLFFDRFNDGLNIWVAELEDNLLEIKKTTMTKCIAVSQAWENVQARVNEGSSVIKHNGVYYMTYSANSYESLSYGVGYATAANVKGPWTKATENPVLQRPTTDLAGTGHGAAFTDKNGRLRYVFHAHSSPTAIHPRKMYITDMTFTADGKIVMDKNNILYAKEYK